MFSTCFCVDFADGPDEDAYGDELISVAETAAAQAETCCECCRNIVPGETCEIVVGIWGGVEDRVVTCVACRNVRQSLCRCAEPWDAVR